MDSGDNLRILVVNPGSTSTRVALFVGATSQGSASLPAPRSGSRTDPWDEFTVRLMSVRGWLAEEGIEKVELSAVVGRGGLLRPVEGGTYLVNEAMLADARGNRQGAHASNLGCALARAIADEAARERAGISSKGPAEELFSGGEIPAFVVDPVSTDEFRELARYSGLREIPRRSLSHALSIHALVQEVCQREGRGLEGSRFVVAHLGGGISVCPVANGQILDANNANSGGPFSPTRAGGLPTQEFLALCLSGKHTFGELKEMTVKRGGLVSYLGTDDAREVEERIDRGDDEARMVYEAMAYQIAKEIGAMATVLNGEVERILLTGGLAASDLLTAWIRERVAFLAPVEVWPEVEEMKALALGALRVLKGEIQAKEY
jgi:butyrate kinase